MFLEGLVTLFLIPEYYCLDAEGNMYSFVEI